MLQNSGVPTCRLDDHGFSLFIHTFHSNLLGARHHCSEPCEAEAALEKLSGFDAQKCQFWIDENMERHCPAVTLGHLLRWEFLNEFRLIFDHHQLQGISDLRRRQTHAGSIVHGLAHGFDKLLRGSIQDFLR